MVMSHTRNGVKKLTQSHKRSCRTQTPSAVIENENTLNFTDFADGHEFRPLCIMTSCLLHVAMSHRKNDVKK